jgi:hypothetical protein
VSNTLHFGLRTAMVALLTGAPALAGIAIVANRRRPMPQAVDRQIFVYLEDSMATRGEIKGAPFDWSTRVRIECVARDTAGANADVNADALQAAVYAALQANVTLSGLAFDTEPKALAWTEDEADTTVSACQAIYSVWHQTAGNVLTA